jgi:hypothetical protein
VLVALEGAVRHCPHGPGFRNDLAWFLATVENPELRDGRRELTLADGNPGFLATRAAAEAELGHFKRATALMRKALEGAGAADEAVFRDQLNRYTSERPWREAMPSPRVR